MNRPRRYRDPQDLVRARCLLKLGRLASTPTHYIHPGDLNWWLFYTENLEDELRNMYFWEEESNLLGWAFLSPEWRAFDVFVRPDLRHTRQAYAMVAWAQRRLAAVLRPTQETSIQTMWVNADDDWLTHVLSDQGFSPTGKEVVHYERSLLEQIPELQLPAGHLARPVAGDAEALARATLSHAAFGSDWPMERYLPRYMNLRHSPVYLADMDLVVVAPDGQHIAFCMCWPDAINKTGLFEPVGTHPAYQGRGFGRQLMVYAMGQLQQRGMRRAVVSTGADNLPARRLYESVGFTLKKRLVTYSKQIEV